MLQRLSSLTASGQFLRVDWGSNFARDLQIITQGRIAQTPQGIHFASSTGSPGIDARGYTFTGASAQAVFWDLGSDQIGASDPFTIEVIVRGTAFPSLAVLATWSFTNVNSSTGIVNGGASDAGKMRGMMTFTGGPPCDIYHWGGNNDYDSNVQMLADNSRQHIVVTKAGGTGATSVVVYRNGVQVASGNSSNGSALTGTGRYFYVGGKHESGASAITGTIERATSWRRVLTAGEVAALYARPGVVYAPRRIWVPISGTTSGSIYTITPSGAIAFTGDNVLIKEKVYAPSGDITFSGGITNFIREKALEPSGQIEFIGTNTITFTNGGVTYTINPSGLIEFTGTNIFTTDRVLLPSGLLDFSGQALYTKDKTYNISGDVTFSGTAGVIFVPFGTPEVSTYRPLTGAGK